MEMVQIALKIPGNIYTTARGIMNCAQRLAGKGVLPQGTQRDGCVFYATMKTTSTISVASGELFISTTSERERVRAISQADAVDMNSFGLALVCADHGVPLFSWKIISDGADENAAGDFRAFVAGYAGAGGRALAEIIRALPANPNDPATYPAIHRMLRGPPPEDVLPDGAPARP